MKISYEQRIELNALSQEVYGSKGYWNNKLVKRGIRMIREGKEIGRRWFYTAEELKEYILNVKSERARITEEAAKANSRPEESLVKP